MELRELDLELPAVRHEGYGSSVVVLPDGTFLWSYIEGKAAVRAVHVDPERGVLGHLKGLKGQLRGSCVPDFQGRGAWVLTTHALHLLSLNPLKIEATIRSGLGSFPSELVGLGGDLLGVARWHGKSLAVVSARENKVLGRVGAPTPEIVIQVGEAFRLFSFELGKWADLCEGKSGSRGRGSLPFGSSPISVSGQSVAVLLGDRLAPSVFLAGADGEALVPVETPEDLAGLAQVMPGGVVAIVDVPTAAVVRKIQAPAGVNALVGAAEDGRILALRRSFWPPDPGDYTGVAVLDPNDLRVRDDARIDRFVCGHASLGRGRAVLVYKETEGMEFPGPASVATVVEW